MTVTDDCAEKRLKAEPADVQEIVKRKRSLPSSSVRDPEAATS